MYSGEFFAQTLDDSAEAVSALVAKIASDERHTDVRVLLYERTNTRLFPDWSMGLVYSANLADRISGWEESPNSSANHAVADAQHEARLHDGPVLTVQLAAGRGRRR